MHYIIFKNYLQHRRTKRAASNSNTTVSTGGQITSPGAGRKMGLSIVLNTEKNKYFMTSAFFEGFKVITYYAVNIYR